MADSQGDHSSGIEQTPLNSRQPGQTQNILDEIGDTPQAGLGGNTEAQEEELKDKVDGAVRSGPKKADQSTGGRVQVGETGDLHDLAARRNSFKE
ncbi:hypothetical protein F4781DRAFT_429369 [Annulohypoxylon bovei var. microspora]|nr:hypothetical protein F4781DRAFT_429369 [Annulohypoxylon bovei var. microspora]